MPIHSRNTPIVFDSQALSLLVSRDARLREVAAEALKRKLPIVVSSITLVEITYPRINRAELDWTVSRLDVIPVSVSIAKSASKLLADAGMHGHSHSIDAVVAATALEFGLQPIIYTSDPDDFRALVGDRARIIAI